MFSGNRHDKADPTAGSTGRAAHAAFEQAGTRARGPRLRRAARRERTGGADDLRAARAGAARRRAPSCWPPGAPRLDGDLPVNTSGGLLSKGHPIGATGVAQICEATWQLRGQAGERQVAGARIAMTQNGGGWLEEDSAAMSVHVLSAD